MIHHLHGSTISGTDEAYNLMTSPLNRRETSYQTVAKKRSKGGMDEQLSHIE